MRRIVVSSWGLFKPTVVAEGALSATGSGCLTRAMWPRIGPIHLGPSAHVKPDRERVATVRHRTVRTKGALSAKTAKLMVFKLVNAAAKTWRRLNGENQLPKVVQGVKFKNGIEVTEMPAHHAA